MTVCFYCGKPITATGRLWRRVVGWESKGVGELRRGGSDIVLREYRDEFACERCVFRLQHGLAPEQESLL